MVPFAQVACASVSVTHVEEAARLIDSAISEAIIKRKPAYIEVRCRQYVRYITHGHAGQAVHVAHIQYDVFALACDGTLAFVRSCACSL